MADGPVWVAFYVTDWLGGTSRLPRTHRSVYHDICCRVWETAKPVSPSEAKMIVSDLPNGQEVLDDLVASGKLQRLAGGALTNDRAMDEAAKAFAKVNQWRVAGKASARARAERRLEGNSNDRSTTVEPPIEQTGNESELELEKKEGSDANASGGKPPNLDLNGGSSGLPDPTGFENKVDWFFHPAVVTFMCSGGANEKSARAFIGKCRATLGAQLAIKRIREAFDEKVSDPVGWLTSRFPKARNNTGVNRRTFDDVDYGPSGKL